LSDQAEHRDQREIPLQAAHGTTPLLAALQRAVTFNRWRVADVRSILATNGQAPSSRPAGQALVLTLPRVPTRSLQLDALSAADCLKVYTATATKADRPQWNACLGDLRRGGTLIIWKIDRLGRNLRDLIDIVTTLQTRGVGVRSLTNGIVDTTTAHGNFVFGMFALRAEYEAALIKERTQAGLLAARARGRTGGRKPTMTPSLINKAQRAPQL